MATHTAKGQHSKAYVCTVEGCSKVFTTLSQQQAHISSHKEKEKKQDICAGNLDFVALLSSVGEEVITTQLGGSTDGLLELVTVEEPGPGLQVVSVGDWPPPVEEEESEARMMSDGLVTLDTRAISSQQGTGNKRRASGGPGPGDRDIPSKIKCEDTTINTIPVTVQYIIEHKDGVQESTINLQDLE